MLVGEPDYMFTTSDIYTTTVGIDIYTIYTIIIMSIDI